jgi:hypothetical protein
VSARACDISEVAQWVFTYLGRADMLARAERFVSNPVQVCSAAGGCESVTKGEGDVKLRHTMEALYGAYHVDDSNSMTDLSPFLPKSEPLEGKTVQVDALDSTCRNKTWLITKIDLSRLGRTALVQRQRDESR